MLFNQYGGRKGVQEISGLINLFKQRTVEPRTP